MLKFEDWGTIGKGFGHEARRGHHGYTVPASGLNLLAGEDQVETPAVLLRR